MLPIWQGSFRIRPLHRLLDSNGHSKIHNDLKVKMCQLGATGGFVLGGSTGEPLPKGHQGVSLVLASARGYDGEPSQPD